MKKTYISPEVKTHKLQAFQIMAASEPETFKGFYKLGQPGLNYQSDLEEGSITFLQENNSVSATDEDLYMH